MKIRSRRNVKKNRSEIDATDHHTQRERLRQGTPDTQHEKKKKILRGVKDGANGNGCKYLIYIYVCVCKLDVADP